MKIIIVGGVAEGKTVFARALQELCRRFGIAVKVTDEDFDADGKERAGWAGGPASLPTRLMGVSKNKITVEIITVRTNRHGNVLREDLHVCEGLMDIINSR